MMCEKRDVSQMFEMKKENEDLLINRNTL